MYNVKAITNHFHFYHSDCNVHVLQLPENQIEVQPLLLANGANFSQTAIYSLCGLDRIIMMNLKSYNSLKINTTNIKTLKCLLCVVIHHCRFDQLREHGHFKFRQCLHADHNVVMWTSFLKKRQHYRSRVMLWIADTVGEKKSTFKSNHCYLMYISV